jgi:hypothetical protein
MLNMAVLVGAIAAALAVVVSALFIGACLLIAWTSDAVRGNRGRAPRGQAPRGTHGAGGARDRAALPAGSHRGRHGPA